MSSGRTILLTVALAVAIASSALRGQPAGVRNPADTATGDVVVNHEPPVVSSRTFDPKTPPPEMPPLKPGEAAVTESSFSCETLVEVLVVSQQPSGAGACRANVRVASVTATLRLAITVWVPHRDAHKLTAHEQGHRQIEERYYAGAKDVADRLSRDMIGQ